MYVHRVSRIVLLPQGFMEIVFYYRDSYKLIRSDGEESHPRVTLYGQRTEFIDILPTGRVGLMSVVFTPVGVRDILHLPLNELTNDTFLWKRRWEERGKIWKNK